MHFVLLAASFLTSDDLPSRPSLGVMPARILEPSIVVVTREVSTAKCQDTPSVGVAIQERLVLACGLKGVSEGEKVVLRIKGAKDATGTVIDVGTKGGFALVSTSAAMPNVARLHSETALEPGDSALAMGIDPSGNPTFQLAVISKVHRNGEQIAAYQVDFAVSPGCGPAIISDLEGRIIGALPHGPVGIGIIVSSAEIQKRIPGRK